MFAHTTARKDNGIEKVNMDRLHLLKPIVSPSRVGLLDGRAMQPSAGQPD